MQKGVRFMELLFESRPERCGPHGGNIEGKVYSVQSRPTIHPEPVLLGDTDIDGAGVAIYGSVIHEAGRFRMWYQAIPRNWDGDDVGQVCYAESDDGVHWDKPDLNLTPGTSKPNNLLKLPCHCPSICIDPDAPPSHRYRATGYGHYVAAGTKAPSNGYHTAHSADGLTWQFDGHKPKWPGSDVITSTYHRRRRCMLVAMKQHHRVGGIPRRAIWMAQGNDDKWSPAHIALVPDEFDDVCAMREGFVSGDYYGMAMMPVGNGVVGFLWQFRHNLPHSTTSHGGLFGLMDVTLVYQNAPHDRWLHAAGRRPFLHYDDVPWLCRGICTASYPIEVGNEQWLYFTSVPRSHGWYLDAAWQLQEDCRRQMVAEGITVIGLARWPKDRLFGFRSDPKGSLRIDVGEVTEPCQLILNYKTHATGSIRVEIPEQDGYALDDAVPLTGDSLARAVAWKTKTTIGPLSADKAKVTLHMDRAEVYAYELTPMT